MRPFVYVRADNAAAVAKAFAGASGRDEPPTSADAQFIAGGTTILDLMKLDVMRPSALVDINGMEGLYKAVEQTRDGLTLGRACPDGGRGAPSARATRLSGHRREPRARGERATPQYGDTRRQRAQAHAVQLFSRPVVGSLQQADARLRLCGARRLQSGSRRPRVSQQCIATYPGDFAQALIALDAIVETRRGDEQRTISFAGLHRPPAERPDVETTLAPDEMIVSFVVPRVDWTHRSRFLKIRGRESYVFALASAAVALDMPRGGAVRRPASRSGESRPFPGGRVRPRRCSRASQSLRIR